MGCGSSVDQSKACPQQAGATLLGDTSTAPAPEKAAGTGGTELAVEQSAGGGEETVSAPETKQAANESTMGCPASDAKDQKETSAAEMEKNLAPPVDEMAPEAPVAPDANLEGSPSDGKSVEVPVPEAKDEVAPLAEVLPDAAVVAQSDSKNESPPVDDSPADVIAAAEAVVGSAEVDKAVPDVPAVNEEAAPVDEALVEATAAAES